MSNVHERYELGPISPSYYDWIEAQTARRCIKIVESHAEHGFQPGGTNDCVKTIVEEIRQAFCLNPGG